MAWPRWLSWVADATAQQLVGAVLGSALLTSIVSALVRQLAILPWDWAWVLWTSTASVTYVLLVRTAHVWLPHLRTSKATHASEEAVLRPTVEMLEAGRRERQSKRELRISEWRRIVFAAHHEMQRASIDGRPITVAAALERHPEFLALKPHISSHSLAGIYGRTAIVAPDNSGMSGALHALLRDIDALEREWGLV